ncbi:AraC family transcriptional regulator [Niabella drilacis]|uniref:AraC-type DNA-binding protein n=1 Tax=Niabella drilacis (strain DSM 25811 / CCM 8410 / CCUG 62505 / LMG 26954 / E90) TaxID=1285928 RepID=A0A1G6L2U4_NIADE|nr:AraC family transcriptional regulator [Niabella drilacis]SDC37494.1 AraC-type DNA-binding protein [Niabella drilacis]
MKPVNTSSAQKKKEGFEGQLACILPQVKVRFCAQHVFCKNLYITDMGYYPLAAHHERERPKGCTQYILIHCVKGKGWYSIANKRYEVKSNEFFIIPPGTAHYYGAHEKDPWSIYWLHFCGADAGFYYQLLTKIQGKAPVSAAVSTSRHLIFYDILQHLELPDNADNLIYGCSCVHAYLSSFLNTQIKLSVNENDVIQQCITFMKQNLDKPLRLDEISAAVGLSSSHLSSLFKKQVKSSPIHLFTSLKIQKACQMLMDRSHNIKTISYSLGYEDQYHFSRVFKKIMGISPKHFKNK